MNVSHAKFCRLCGSPLATIPVVSQTIPQISKVATTIPDPVVMPKPDISKPDSRIQISVPNPEQPHCATVLLLDVSGSMMDNDKIGQLNAGLQMFKEELMKDDLASRRIDVSVITFGENVKVISPFCSITDFHPPKLEANGGTPMGEAINRAIDIIEERKKVYQNEGIDYFRPWIFMITDGEPTDMSIPSTAGTPSSFSVAQHDMWKSVCNRIRECDAHNKLVFMGVGVEPANFDVLNQLLPPNRRPFKLRKGNFREMFVWLSNSQEKVVRSDLQAGDMASLTAVGVDSWADSTSNNK